MDNKSTKFIRLKKIVASVALFFLVFQLFVPALAHPRSAQAVLGIGDVTTIASNIWDTIWKVSLRALNVVVAVGYKNMLSTFLNKVAYDTAVYIGSGGKGQKPFFMTQPLGVYFKDMADAAYGDFLDGLSKEVWGRSLCDTDPIIKVKFSAWALKIKKPPEPKALRGKCTITKIGESIKKTTQGQLIDFSTKFNPEANDFGAFLSITSGAQKAADEKRRIKTLERLIYGEFDQKKSTITGETRTPSEVIKETYKESYRQAFKRYTTFTGDAAADALGIFTNTLVSQMMKTIFEKGLNPELDDIGAEFVSGGSRGIAAAKILFASLAQPDYVTGGEINIMDNLSSCPDRENPLPDTCVIDSRFRTAIEEKITVQQAINKGLLDASKTVGYDINGLEPNYLNGYPYRSLLILRKYRILPVGWELAAKYIKQYSPGNYSLGSLIDDYDNEESPFYHLVDPNWVLKAPAAYCNRRGASEKVVYEQVIRGEDTSGDNSIDVNDVGINLLQRQDYCADEQTCILEADDGSCKKYGYCIEENPIWRFNATSCESQYNTCQSFANREGDTVSYLKNSVDYNNCSSNNVGCQWYCQDWNINTSQWICTSQVPPAGGNKISFNYQAETCSPTDDGCHEYMAYKGTGANVLVNSDFELYERVYNGGLLTDGIANTDRPDNFYGWWGGGTTPLAPVGTQCFGGPDDGVAGCVTDDDCAEEGVCTNQGGWCGDRLYASTRAYEGNTAARISYVNANCSVGDPAHYTIQTIDTGHLTNNRTFTVSFYTRLDPDDAVDCAADPGQVSFQLMRVIDDSVSPAVADYRPSSLVNTITNNWTRYTRTFTFGVPTDDWGGADIEKNQREIKLFFRRQGMASGGSCDILIDNVKVEEGGLTDYNPYEENQKTYLKKPPAYLGCTDDLNANDPVCDSYALYCSEDEVGCRQYTSSSGDVVNGIVTDPAICDFNDPASCDQCPADYVGCKAFKELATENMPIRPERDPVSFVPATGTVCSASAVGCEEYTNLNEVAMGGEGREYYSLIRQCVEADDAEATTYYTWEGSDEFGYQLKSYHLKTTNIAGSNAPCTNINPEPDGWPACNDSNDSADSNYWADCSDTCDGATNTCTNNARISCEADIDCIRANYDCREFYDSAGNTFYRLKSRVIYAAEECTPYRNSIDGVSKTYHMIPGQGIVCDAEYAGCRAYKGNAGDNIRTVYSEQFENGSVAPWTGDVNYSNESIHQGGHSMLVSGTPQSIARANEAGNDLGLQSDRSYTFSFWAKGAGSNSNVTVGFTGFLFPGTANVQADDWNLFSLGPFYIPADLVVELRPFDIIGSSAFYIDNIVIEEITDNIYYIKDSYTDCSGWENCDAYTDVHGNINYLKSFTRLCSEEKIGCQALLDTQNSQSPFATTYPIASGVDGTVPADTTVTMVVDSEKSCVASEKGCQRLGLPSIDADGLVSGYEDSMVKNDPDKYNQILCKFEHSGCEEYTTADDQKFYFKDPGTKTCLYQKVGGQDTYGWYKQGTTTGSPDCPVATGFCEVGSANAYDLCNSNDDCDGGDCHQDENIIQQPIDGWVGLCPENASGCTQIVDPEDPVNPLDQICDITVPGHCKSYYYLSQELDQNSCNGIVNREEGCRLLYDTSNSILNYNTDATEDGHTPALCTTPGVMSEASGDCNANTVLQVVKDRVCGTWLECASSWQIDNPNTGKVENLCLQRMACNQMDEQTGQCINPIDLSKINETYNTPVFVDEIKNYSGMVLAGLDWDRRCDNTGALCTCVTSGVSCVSDADCGAGDSCCGTGTCQEPQVIEGYFPFSAMEQVGMSGASENDLILDGDFFDANYAENYKLSVNLSCDYLGAGVCGYDGTNPQPPYPTPGNWSPMGEVGKVKIKIVEDGANVYGNSWNLDENNILEVLTKVSPPDDWWGTKVKFSDSVSTDQEYVLSYKVKRKVIPENASDYVMAFFGWEPVGDPVHPSGHHWITLIRSRVNGQPVGTEWESFAVKFNIAEIVSQWAAGTCNGGSNNGGSCHGNPDCPGGTCIGGVSEDLIFAEINSASNFHIRFQTPNLGGGLGSDIPFYLDDVSLKPALEVQNPPDPSTLVARSCRMYPKTDASLCSYTDENLVTYNGWYGYCLERDPQYPQYCLNWWPIDLIAGESNIFGESGADVRYTGRRPLYYCMQAEGNSEPRLTWSIGPLYSGANYNVDVFGSWVPGTSGTENCCDTDDCGGDHSCSEPDIVSCNWGCGGTSSRPVGNTNITEDNIQELTFSWSDVGSCHWDVIKPIINKDIVSAGGTCGSCGDQQHRYQRIDDGVNPIIWYLYPTSCSDDDGADGSDNRVCLWIQFIFNQTTKKLQRVRIISEDTKQSDEGATLRYNFVLREPCKKIVQVVGLTGEPKVWAERVKPSSEFVAGDLPGDLNYRYKYDYAPFGGLISPDNVNAPPSWSPSSVPIFVEQYENPPTDSWARAGSPYACDDKCETRVCYNPILDEDYSGNHCLNDAQVNACIAGPDGLTGPGHDTDNGWCIGLGTGFCIDNPLQRCQNSGDCNTGDCNLDNWPTQKSLGSIDRLKRVFAAPLDKIGVGWEWDYDVDDYVPDESYNWYDDFDNMSICSDPSDRDTFSPADDADYCAIQPEANFTLGVGDQQYNSGIVNLGSGGNIQLVLSMRTNPEQAPITRYEIRWDEAGPITQNKGRFPDGSQIFTHFYNSQPGPDYPRIQIEDNWGFCSNPTLAGPLPEKRQSCNSDHQYWVHFDGQIIVNP